MRVVEFPVILESRREDGDVVWLRFSDGVEGTVDLAGYPTTDVFDIAAEHLYARLTVKGRARKRDYASENDDALRQAHAECAAMPEISRFFGIVIRMFWTEHEAPHFHAQYADYLAAIEIESGAVRTHRFPARALRIIEEWRERHAAELMANWHRMRRGEAPLPIAPLE